MQFTEFNDAGRIARHIIEHTRGEIRLALPLGLGKANTIVNALTEAALADSTLSLHIFTALTLEKPTPGSDLEQRFYAPAMDRLFGRYPALRYAELLHADELPDNIQVSEFFLLAGRWRGNPHMQGNYIAANYTHALDYLAARKPNVVAHIVARDDGRYSLSCNPDITPGLLAQRELGQLDFLLAAEINEELPFMAGGAAEVESGEIDCLLDDPATTFELFSAVKQPVDDSDMAIGLHASRLVEDGGTLQIGIGSIGDALCAALLLRHKHNDQWLKIIQASPFSAEPGAELMHERPFDTGLYACSEMLVDGLLQLFNGGVLQREVDGATVHAGFFVGTRDFYRSLRDMPPHQRQKVSMQPIAFTNSLYGDESNRRAARVKARFVNNAMLATLLGAVTSDGTGDGQVVSGVGGQFDFVAQAFALADARSIITLNATRETGGKTVSNILWHYPHTTIPRHLKDIVVTEYGMADLRGKSDQETIAAMLAIADSRFQDELLEQAKDAGKCPGDYSLPDQYRHNNPDRLHAWLKPFRDTGTLKRFPFGTDFTDIEQTLMPALAAMKKVQHARFEAATLAWRGLIGSPAPNEPQCLERMGLDQPRRFKDRIAAALLRGALRAEAESHARHSPARH